MNREEIVTNGCSGGCCEKFTLPVTLNDLSQMRLMYNDDGSEKENYGILVCENGYKRWPCNFTDLVKLIDMLVPLGQTDICPQSCKPFLEPITSKCIDDKGNYISEKIHEISGGHYMISDKTITANIYTCKHFDTVNRICTNYENRPWLCRQFGPNCHYAGCKMTEKLKENELSSAI